MYCGCSYAPNPLSKGCSQKARSKNIARLIREGYDARQAAAIAYSTQRKAGCKVPKRKANRNPPYEVYGVHEYNIAGSDDLATAITTARDTHEDWFDKVVVYDAGRKDRGPKGEFVAMFRPNKKRRKKGKRASRSYKANPGLLDIALIGLAAVGGWWLWKQYGAKAKAAATTATTTAGQVVTSVRPTLVR